MISPVINENTQELPNAETEQVSNAETEQVSNAETEQVSSHICQDTVNIVQKELDRMQEYVLSLIHI